jgi:hypothetical protein
LCAHPRLHELLEPVHRGPEIGTLSGGHLLIRDDVILARPQCCADLHDFSGWRAAATERASVWSMLYIGHPWVSVRGEGELLQFSKPHEGGPTELDFEISRAALGAAVDTAAIELASLVEPMAAGVARWRDDVSPREAAGRS